MTAHDPRTPLNQGSRLTLQNHKYTIRDVVGFGGSCFAYYAEREPNENENKIGVSVLESSKSW